MSGSTVNVPENVTAALSAAKAACQAWNPQVPVPPGLPEQVPPEVYACSTLSAPDWTLATAAPAVLPLLLVFVVFSWFIVHFLVAPILMALVRFLRELARGAMGGSGESEGRLP